MVKKTPKCAANYISDWYWDPATYQCIGGTFFGCRTGGYGFSTKEECQKQCSPVTTLSYYDTKSHNPKCNLPAEPGTKNCNRGWATMAYFYDVTTGHCKRFKHWGCDLNANNFPTLQDCKRSCYQGRQSAWVLPTQF